MATSDIVFFFFIGLCNYVSFRDLFTYGIKAGYVSVDRKRIFAATSFGLPRPKTSDRKSWVCLPGATAIVD
jgi:hypothetical protein